MLNDSSVNAVKENIKNVWTDLLQILRHFKESAVNMSNPSILAEQLQIIFRDESKTDHLSNLFQVVLKKPSFDFSRPKQSVFCVHWIRSWNNMWLHDRHLDR